MIDYSDLTLVFDLDGTLVDTAPDLIAAANHVLQAQDLEAVEAHQIRDQISFGARAMIAKGLQIRQAPRSPAEIDKLLADFLVHYEANIAATSQPFPQAIGVLERWRARGCRIAVCTNKREHLSRLLLGELGIMPLIHGLAGRDTFAVCKPNPDHLRGAVNLAGGNIARSIMIGDSDTDISTARAAGIPSVAVTFGYTEIPARDLGATAVIDHFEEFDDAVMRILGGMHRPGSRT